MRYLVILCFVSLLVCCLADDGLTGPDPTLLTHDQKLLAVESLLQFEKTADLLDKYEREHILTNDELQKAYESFTNSIVTIQENMQNPDYISAFLLHDGINRVVMPHLTTTHRPGVVPQLLLLVRTLFEHAPMTTAATAPPKLIEKLLDLLDLDENRKFTTPILDILMLWLPERTTVQTRFLKSGGLQTLYEEIPHLETDQVHKILQFFTGIIREHLDVRMSQKSEADNLKLKEYQKVGLLDMLANKNVCKGLLMIFEYALTKHQGNNDIFVTILELLVNTREFCMEHFKKQANSLDVFEKFLYYVQESETLGEMDVDEIERVLTEDVEGLRFLKVKEEL